MSPREQTIWQRWMRRPQNIWARRVVFQIHLWSGIALGLYVFMISVTGSVLVYRDHLFRWATRAPIISTAEGPRLSDEQLKDAALRAYPGYDVAYFGRARNPDQAVEIWVRRGDAEQRRLFDPRTGRDLGSTVPFGIWLVSSTIDLHDNLLGGPTGREVNGAGAVAVLLLATTGLVIWWPGIDTWKRSLTVHRGVGWKRFVWDLHSMVGFWTLAFVLLFTITGLYLSYQPFFLDLGDLIEPPTAANEGLRLVDTVEYWLAFLHFGRICGIGIPCSGPGLCDQATKFTWAAFGMAPAVMFVTGAIMWWTRVLRPRWLRRSRRQS